MSSGDRLAYQIPERVRWKAPVVAARILRSYVCYRHQPWLATIRLPVILGSTYRMAVEFQAFSRLGAATKKLTRKAAAVMPTETHKAGE